MNTRALALRGRAGEGGANERRYTGGDAQRERTLMAGLRLVASADTVPKRAEDGAREHERPELRLAAFNPGRPRRGSMTNRNPGEGTPGTAASYENLVARVDEIHAEANARVDALQEKADARVKEADARVKEADARVKEALGEARETIAWAREVQTREAAVQRHEIEAERRDAEKAALAARTPISMPRKILAPTFTSIVFQRLVAHEESHEGTVEFGNVPNLQNPRFEVRVHSVPDGYTDRRGIRTMVAADAEAGRVTIISEDKRRLLVEAQDQNSVDGLQIEVGGERLDYDEGIRVALRHILGPNYQDRML